MKYVVRLWANSAANRFSLKMAPPHCSGSRTGPNLPRETPPKIAGHTEQLIFHQVVSFVEQFEHVLEHAS